MSAAGQTKQRPAQELPGRAFDLPIHPRSGRSGATRRRDGKLHPDRSMLEALRRVTSLGTGVTMTDQPRKRELSSTACPSRRLSMPRPPRPKVIKIRDGIDVAARYFVYKLYDFTRGLQIQWRVLHGMGELSGDHFTGG